MLAAEALAALDPTTLLARVKSMSASVQDIKARMVIIDAEKKSIRDINPSLIEGLGIKEMDVFYKHPDKFRAEALAKGLQLTWVLNGDRQVISVPGLMIRKVENVGGQAGKKRSSLDMGFISEALWEDFNVSIIGEKNGLCQLKLLPKGDRTRRKEIIWIEPRTLKLVKRERYGSGGDLKVRYHYSDFRMVGRLPVAQRAKVYDPQGDFAGTVEYRNLRGNTGLPSSLFSLSVR